ncbi:MAG: hypothetical protein K2L16_01685, partial [Muribaculaceae bacterium]|nr:hypothetical protein [Muribaculaceae bacterium]
MEITLPPRKDGHSPSVLTIDAGSPLVIIGANGAGKTRFTRAIVDSLGDKALRLNALGALYERRQSERQEASALSRRFSQAVIGSPDHRVTPPTTLELLLSQLMHDEMLNLIGYKLSLADGRQARLRRTRLDKVIEIWQEVFPGNRVLIDSGRMLFSRGLDDDGYSALRLSDGERAVLYYT